MNSHQVYIEGRAVTVDPSRSIGKGGEADVFDLGGGQALKLFKPPDHPDLQASPADQAAARDRLHEHQYKLRVFPSTLPPAVIAPTHLATDASEEQILGYTMTLIRGAVALHRYSDRQFRQRGISAQAVVQIFRALHPVLHQIHQAQVVIGDFNDLNILVKGEQIYLIDADSYQFDSFLCRMYTTPFLDPLLCDPEESVPILAKPYSPLSDWYAFAVMLMQCLLFVSPYGGVYRPQDPTQKIPHEARPLHRITVFHPQVRYPKPALPYEVLPDDLLHHFHLTFERDHRAPFPLDLFDQLNWTVCTLCGLEHSRSACPKCLKSGAIRPVNQVRGSVMARSVFKTQGIILTSRLHRGHLLWLYHDQGRFCREQGQTILLGELDPRVRFGLGADQTLIGKEDQVILLHPHQEPERIRVDPYRHLPMFDVNDRGYYWLHNGQLLRQGSLGPIHMGDVLSHQTQFWVGSRFGFGFYQAGRITVGFTFEAEGAGLNDRVRLPQWSGQWVNSTCYFSPDLCWLFLAIQGRNALIHHCVVIQADGHVIATAKGVRGDGSWMDSIWGKCAVGGFLLVATDEGVVRVEPQQAGIEVTKTFPDTEPFVDHHCQIWAAPEGLYVIKQREITLIQIR